MKLNRRTFLGTSTAGLVGWLELPASGLLAAAAGGEPTGVKEPARPGNSSTLETLKALWDKPERTHKPHTRWWWPGNALSPADIKAAPAP